MLLTAKVKATFEETPGALNAFQVVFEGWFFIRRLRKSMFASLVPSMQHFGNKRIRALVAQLKIASHHSEM
jgi:hypothetical protein